MRKAGYTNTGNKQGQALELPNAKPALVLGILSLTTCWCYGVLGLAFGIVALVIANKDMARYQLEPEVYSQPSYKNLKTARIIAIIAICCSALFTLVIAIALLIEADIDFPWLGLT